MLINILIINALICGALAITAHRDGLDCSLFFFLGGFANSIILGLIYSLAYIVGKK